MADGLLVERLRQDLRDLTPEARALLIAELERGLLRGDETAGAELVLQELRRSAREPSRPSPRTGSLARLFFQPLEPFLVDDTATHKHPGRIARVALDPIWSGLRQPMDASYFIAGPPHMLTSLEADLRRRGVRSEAIHIDAWE